MADNNKENRMIIDDFDSAHEDANGFDFDHEDANDDTLMLPLGLLVPDLPLEQTDALCSLSALHGLELVLLTTPTTPKERMLEISQASQGFVYLVSLTGVTGARSEVNSRVESLLQELKKVTAKPVAVGFGISTAEHAIQWGADGVIMGSAMVKLLGEAPSPKEGTFSKTYERHCHDTKRRGKKTFLLEHHMGLTPHRLTNITIKFANKCFN
ncbi:hypothetical protein L7F22_058047 [Adiantum nelumboides]|nr:hypothetical protein [Adiantum nelumboides]